MADWMGLEIPAWLLVLIAVGLVFFASRQQAPSPTHPASETGGPKEKSGSGEGPSASDAAKGVAARLGVSIRARRVPVTVCVNDVVLRREPGGEWVSIESAVRVVELLSEVASVFLVAWVDSDEDERQVKEMALSSGLTRPPDANSSPTNTPGIPPHRLLFCSSHIGQVAIVRQLASSVHIGGPIALLEGVSRFVPSLVRIDPDAIPPIPGDLSLSGSPSGNEGRRLGDNLGWREFKSLSAAAGLVSPRASESSATPTQAVARSSETAPATEGSSCESPSGRTTTESKPDEAKGAALAGDACSSPPPKDADFAAAPGLA